jgi:hypothetical protein
LGGCILMLLFSKVVSLFFYIEISQTTTPLLHFSCHWKALNK